MVIVGAIRMPATAASTAPSAHESCATRSGYTPFMPARSRLSTTARIVTPVRVWNMNNRRKAAMRPATPRVISWWYVTRTPASSMSLPAKNSGRRRPTCCDQISVEIPSRMRSRASVTTMVTVMGAA